jgi:serine/threonine protein kinase
MTAESIGRYQIRSEIGRGGASTVYLAYDPNLRRELVVKTLHKELLNAPAFRARFEREALFVARLEHPAIVPVYDFGVHEDQPYMAMRHMTGGSLFDRFEGKAVPPEEVRPILFRIASALDSAHERGIVHRNIKPSNILFDAYGESFLSDFGIAHLMEQSWLTGSTLFGAPAYMAPEQVLGKELDGRTDIYQLGVVLFELLTGQLPYSADTPMRVAIMQVQEPIPSLLKFNPALSPEYDKIIARAMAKDPEKRFSSTVKMSEVFATIIDTVGRGVFAKPIDNPFVVGSPVEGSLFVGREEIFRQLEEIWGNDAKQSVDSAVLFGHRRMGKTSILHNLQRRFGEDTLIAVFTMQRAGRLKSTGELLSYIALSLFDALEDAGYHGLQEPVPDTFDENGYQTFNRFLRSVHRSFVHPGAIEQKKSSLFSRFFDKVKQPQDKKPDLTRIILAIDEFELIEDAIADGRVDAEILSFLRGVIHSERWLILALAGLHTLEEMTADYWNPLYASVTPVRVSFMSRAATANLLTEPAEDFPLEFTNATIDRLFALVQGQPYLTQLIAHSLVRNYNQKVFEEGAIRTTRFAPEDVDDIVNSPDFYEQGNYYFSGVWGQAEQSEPEGQLALLKSIARSIEPVHVDSLVATTHSSETAVRACLATLSQHDVVKVDNEGRCDFAVPLMRHWIREYKSTAVSTDRQ